jgi:hypothetical protein
MKPYRQYAANCHSLQWLELSLFNILALLCLNKNEKGSRKHLSEMLVLIKRRAIYIDTHSFNAALT